MMRSIGRFVLAVTAVVAAIVRIQAADAVPNPIVAGPISGGALGQPFGAMSAARRR